MPSSSTLHREDEDQTQTTRVQYSGPQSTGPWVNVQPSLERLSSLIHVPISHSCSFHTMHCVSYNIVSLAHGLLSKTQANHHHWVSGRIYLLGKYEGSDPHNALSQLQYIVLSYPGTKYIYLPWQYFEIFTLEVFECSVDFKTFRVKMLHTFREPIFYI